MKKRKKKLNKPLNTCRLSAIHYFIFLANLLSFSKDWKDHKEFFSVGRVKISYINVYQTLVANVKKFFRMKNWFTNVEVCTGCPMQD